MQDTLDVEDAVGTGAAGWVRICVVGHDSAGVVVHDDEAGGFLDGYERELPFRESQ